MMTFRRTVTTAAAVVLVTGAALAPSTAAQAAPPSSCTNSSVCGYVNSGYRTDQGYELIPVQPAGTCEGMSFPNAWSGLFNNSGRSIRLYKNSGCSGEYITFANGDGHAQFSVAHPTYENNSESFKFM
jgi:hypothetical protein